jgi:hypothetical protein
VVALVNEYSLQSRFQPREFELAAEQKKLLPYVVSDMDYRALPALFQDMHAPKITAEMIAADVGKNRISMLGDEAEALIATSRSSGAVAPAEPQPPPEVQQPSGWRWMFLVAGLLTGVAIAAMATKPTREEHRVQARLAYEHAVQRGLYEQSEHETIQPSYLRSDTFADVLVGSTYHQELNNRVEANCWGAFKRVYCHVSRGPEA